MYGASTILVFATKGGGVNGFTLDTGIGEFVLTHKNMRIPTRGKIYSLNEGNQYGPPPSPVLRPPTRELPRRLTWASVWQC